MEDFEIIELEDKPCSNCGRKPSQRSIEDMPKVICHICELKNTNVE